MKNRKIISTVAMTAALTAGGAAGAIAGYPTISGAQDAPTTTEAPAADAGSDTAAPEEGRRHKGHGPDLENAAGALGVTTDELRTSLQDGKSLADVAEEQGVDTQVVIDALVAAGEERLDEAKANLPEQVAELVERTPGEGKGMRGGPRGHGPRGDAPSGDAETGAEAPTEDGGN